MRFLTDKNNHVRGWRIMVVFGVMLIVFAVKLSYLGWSNNTRTALIVLVVMFGSMGLGMWAIDWAQRRRAARQARGQPSRMPDWLFETKSTRMTPLLGGLLGIVLIPTFIALIGPIFYHEWASLGWIKTQGETVSVDVQRGYDGYSVTAEMRYQFAGQWHCQHMPARGLNSIRSQSEARALERKFAPGTLHDVFVDPAQPTRASFNRGPAIGTMIGTVTIPLFGVAFFVASLQAVRKGLRRAPAAVTADENEKGQRTKLAAYEPRQP